jgi:hypothetical protein
MPDRPRGRRVTIQALVAAEAAASDDDTLTDRWS